MLTSASIATAAEGRLPGGPGLHLVELGADFSPMMELATGTFSPRGERAAFSPAHPLNLLWQAFAHEVASGSPLLYDAQISQYRATLDAGGDPP